MNRGDYSTEFLSTVAKIAAEIDPADIDRIVQTLSGVREAGGRVFFLGVGGGASHAGHAVNDLRKIAGIEAYSPSDNIAELTARINDHGWSRAYADWLRGSRLGGNDAIFIFSVGGGDAEKNISVNLVESVRLAREVGAKIVGIVGPNRGYTGSMADLAIVVPLHAPEMVTALTESFQSVLWHAIVSHPGLRVNEMKWESER